LESAAALLKAHSAYLTPPRGYAIKQNEIALNAAKQSFRAAFVKLSTDKSDAKREFAYGALSTDTISNLYKLARKITWPLLGVGTVAGIITEIADDRETGNDDPTPGHEDVRKAIFILDRPCRELNALCREGIQHILATLKLGVYTPPSPLSRLFKKPKPKADDENATDIGTNAFLGRFDAGVDTFRAQKTNHLDQFYDKNHTVPSQGLFLVLFVEFLILAVAAEIRSVVTFVDELKAQGAVDRKMFIVPKMKVLRKALGQIFKTRGTEELGGDGYGGEEGDVYAENFTGRVNRTSTSPLSPPSLSQISDVVL
jgi:hypothetical protein